MKRSKPTVTLRRNKPTTTRNNNTKSTPPLPPQTLTYDPDVLSIAHEDAAAHASE